MLLILFLRYVLFDDLQGVDRHLGSILGAEIVNMPGAE